MIQKEINKKLAQLENRKIKLEERKFKAQLEEHRKLDNIGWGAGMRGYKCMTIKLDKSSKIQEQINDVIEQINFLKEVLL